MSELPKGWVQTVLGEVLISVIGGGTPSRNIPSYFDGTIPWFTVKDMKSLRPSDAEEHITEIAIMNSATNLIPPRTLIVATRIALGRAIRPSIACAINQDLKALILGKGIDVDFLLYWVGAHNRVIQDLGSGTTVSGIRLDALHSLPLHLPPAAEQTRIVAKLEELLSDLDAGVAELKAAQKKLGQYRQLLLKAAVEGTLTAEWREAQRKRRSTPLSPRGRGAGGEGIQTLNTSDAIWFRDRARQLRKEQTPMEQWLWQLLRAKRFSGFKFRRQQTIGRYIVDFVCFAQKLIIELDGSQHADAQEEDAARDHWLRGEGFRVLRFWNNELQQQTDAVLEMIWSALQESQEPPLPNPSPTRGEGLNTSIFLNGGEGETGAQLLERILIERRARWEKKQLAKFKEQGKTPLKDWQKKYPEPVQPDTTDLPELPQGWVWATIDQLAAIGTGVTPLKSKSQYYVDGDIPWVTSGALNNEMVTEAIDYVTPLALKECRLELYPAGTLLVAMYGEGKTRGKCSELAIPATINQAIAALILEEAAIDCKSYIKSFLLKSYDDMRNQASGGVQPNLNLQIVRSIVIPIPPIDEQCAITSALSAQLEAAQDQWMAIDLSIKQSAAQRQNILRAAFSGQQVLQDPNDEPASVLLERIHAERVERNVLKKPRGRKMKETS